MRNNSKVFKKISGGALILAMLFASPAWATEERQLVPLGQTVGVTLHMKGVTVVDTADVIGCDGKKSAPARQSGLESGDVIEEVNGQSVESAEEFEETVKKSGEEPMTLLVRRGEKRREVTVTPSQSDEDDSYRIGVWIKDAASGIGTMTYYDPKTGVFGALGHGIAEESVQETIVAESGRIYRAQIVSVQKGGRGQIGELVGVFCEEDEELGFVTANTESGLKGTIRQAADLDLLREAMPVATRDEVCEGEAEILANIEDRKIEAYTVEIQKINQDLSSRKGMVVKVTDPRLLEKTGGIVQGMSGSPIMQNGKIVGAVTHVFVNDSTRGYGIFIENMLAEEG